MNKISDFDVKVLQSLLEERGVKIKILHFEVLPSEDAWLVYTTHLDYVPEIPNESREYLTAEEEDIFVLNFDGEWDYQEAAADICWKEKGSAK
jgi:hypothetical protein